MPQARLSAGISSDTGIKETPASSFAEILRARKRGGFASAWDCSPPSARPRPSSGCSARCGHHEQLYRNLESADHNLAVVAPGIAEALLATAIGLVAADPGVIIYNHFARVTKTYLELVSRASGAAGRLLSRDLDRTHVSSSTHSRAAE